VFYRAIIFGPSLPLRISRIKAQAVGIKMGESSRPSLQIDLNEFKLHLHLKGRTPFTLHFNSPSRSFYLSVISLVVNEMKKSGKIKSIPLQEHIDLLALLNETIGGAAGSSEKENLLHRIYTKWRDALPNLEDAPLFKVEGKKKKEEGDGAIGKVYSFTDAEKDGWANLFDYMGSEENVRLKFAIDKIGVGLNEISITFGDYRSGEAWDQFIASLKPALIEVASIDRMKHSLPDGPSIAVLPFLNLSNDKEQEYFSDGMTDDLITDLSKISGLMVISRNSSFTYKGKPVKAKNVAEDLGVRYILQGSVRKAGEEIRINAQLIDAMTGHHLWAERYDGTMDRVFALQDKVTQNIVTALAVKLTGSEKDQMAWKGTNNVKAYDLFLRGRSHYLRYTSEDIGKAVQSYKNATEIDPNFTRAYGELALALWTGTYVVGFWKGLDIDINEARLRVREYLGLAMKNPSAIAHHVNGMLYLFRRQHDKAISEQQRALALDPNDPSCNLGMGFVMNFSGKPRTAIDFFNRALRLLPHNPARYLIQLGIAQFCLGNLEEAATLMEKAQRINPDLTGWAAWLSSIYGLLGREKEARQALDIYQKGWTVKQKLPLVMFFFPFKDQSVANRYAEGIIKAGLPGTPSGYFPAFPENQLTGDEIRRLFFGAKITGFGFDRQQWFLDRKSNGEFAWQGGEPVHTDTGKSRIEGDMICSKYQKRFWGIESCGTVFKNPSGTQEEENIYFSCNDWGIEPFTLVR